MVVSELGTFLIYTFSCIIFKNYINVDQILNIEFVVKWLIITLVSWLPLHISKLAFRKFDPSEHEKIMKRVRTRKVIKNEKKNIEMSIA